MRLVWVIIPLVFFGIVGIQESFALSCADSTWDEEFDRVDVVFTGKVISKEYLPFNDDRPLEKIAISTLQVEEIYKGSLNNTVNISSDEGFWGIHLTKDWRYVIFANGDEDSVNIPLCTKSGPLPPIPDSEKIEYAENKLKQLNSFLLERNISVTIKNEPSMLSPKQQMKTGILPSEVECKADLELIFKSSGTPACVKSSTAEKLVQRGWLINEESVSK